MLAAGVEQIVEWINAEGFRYESRSHGEVLGWFLEPAAGGDVAVRVRLLGQQGRSGFNVNMPFEQSLIPVMARPQSDFMRTEPDRLIVAIEGGVLDFEDHLGRTIGASK